MEVGSLVANAIVGMSARGLFDDWKAVAMEGEVVGGTFIGEKVGTLVGAEVLNLMVGVNDGMIVVGV